MNYKILKNYHVAKMLGLSHPTVARWVEGALEKQNNLELNQVKNKYYIIDSPHNEAELMRLKENAVKYRNKKAHEHVVVDSTLYKVLNEDQVVELITSLEYNRRIPLKFTFKNGGGEIWDNYVKRMQNNDNYYLDKLSELLDSCLDYLSMRLKKYKMINIIDIGVGNGYTLKPLIEKLKLHSVVNYTGIDISPEMLSILETNLKSWYRDIPVKLLATDIEQTTIRTLTFTNKIKFTDSCNLMVFIGATVGNVNDRLGLLRNLHSSMSEDDYLLIDNGLDTPRWRSSFTTVSDPIYRSMLLWIPELLGLKKGMYDIQNRYDEKSGSRLQTMKLNKDVTMEFRLSHGTKQIEFVEGEEIIVWNHFSHSLKGFESELNQAGLEISHFSCYSDKSHVLALAEATMNSL